MGGGAALDAAVLQHPSLCLGRGALSHVASCSSSRLWRLRCFGIKLLESRDMHLQACSHWVFPPSIKHPSPKNQFWDHLLVKKALQAVANMLTERASNTQITPASTSEPCGSANSCPTSGFQLLAQRWVWQGHRNRGQWAKVAAELSVRGCA